MTERGKILIIDDEETIRFSLKTALKAQGYEVDVAADAESGLQIFEQKSPHLVFLDLRLPGEDGLTALKKVRQSDSEAAVIIITAYGDTMSAVTAMKDGAYDYLTKPFELDEILILVQKFFAARSLAQQAEIYRYQQKSRLESERFIASSPAMLKIMEEVKKVAATEATVLIQGETGTGKEMVAQAIHQNSRRAAKPFIDINCGTLPVNLVESELFGFEKSAFTSASNPKKGLIELADRGTLFLDEVGELPQSAQVKLLRFLENKSFKKIGGTKDITVDVRIIAATNKVLYDHVKRGRFRADLYYRLNVVPLRIPPLRQRREDILPMAEYFVEKFCRSLGKKKKKLAGALQEFLLEYQWPGNVRELKNLMERLVILSSDGDEYLDAEMLPVELGVKNAQQGSGEEKNLLTDSAAGIEISGEGNFKQTGADLARELEEYLQQFFSKSSYESEGFSMERFISGIEQRLIRHALIKYRWNLTKTAESLGMTRFSLKRRMDKYFGEE
ncbi:MAG: sigma-54-dependent transcriptional regulator [Dethiobacteria bacterium]